MQQTGRMTTSLPEPTRTFTEVARDISNVRDADLLLSSIARRARILLGTDTAYISLNDLDASETYIRSTDGVRSESYSKIRMPLGTGVLGLAASGVIAETPDYLPDEGKTHLPNIDRAVIDEGVRAILGAPLRVAGKVVGALLVANRSPGAFTPQQRERLEQIASLTATAVELVSAKENESHAAAKAAAAESARDRTIADATNRAELEERLSQALAEGAGLVDIVTLAARITGAHIRVTVPSGAELASSAAHGDVGGAYEETAALIGDSGPGTVTARGEEPFQNPGIIAATTARYASIALLYERTIDEVRHFHENEIVSKLLSQPDAERPELSASVIRRALGTEGALSVAVLTTADHDDPSLRRLLARVRPLTRAGFAVVSSYLGRVVVVARCTGAELAARLGPLTEDLGHFGGIATTPEISSAPAAYAQAAGIAAAMRALDRPGIIATAAEAGVAGLLLKDGGDAGARAFLVAHLSPLIDQSRGETLLRTALTFLDTRSSIHETGQALGIHPNTVRQRVERLDNALGPHWRRGARSLDVHVALRVWQLGSATGNSSAAPG